MEDPVRRRMAVAVMALAMLVLAVPAAAQSPVQTSRAPTSGDARRGEQLYHSRCGACHSLDANRVGPLHRGVFGRRVASVSDFRYSSALRKRSFVWDADMLDQWLANPIALVPGTTMGIRVPAAQDRADIIAWLRSQSVQSSP
jgi:cytochrome c